MLKTEDYIKTILSCVMLVVGNAFSLLFFSKYFCNMSCYHFITQLALTNISVCILVPTKEINKSFFKEHMHMGEFTC